jgi:hypothetical protein
MVYFNFIVNLQTVLSEKIEFRRRAEDKVLREFY